ncbi:MAG TPA: hypothetical protein VHW03_07705, partial [Chthoniobacterales bacterium]|nr:hypothetical protein [Chthoniobacterales bacterium]
MADPDYRFAPILLIRMAGVPFDAVDRLATRATSEAARALLVRQGEFDSAKKAVEQLLQSREHGLAEKDFRVWRRAVRSGVMPSTSAPQAGPFEHLLDCAARFSSAQDKLAATLEGDVSNAREALLEEARTHLSAYLVFASAGVRDRVIRQLAATTAPLPPRHKQARADERHLLLYLQRISAKNDSLSAFGPEGWGTIDPQVAGIHFHPEPGIATRETFLERWTAHGAAAAVNADPEVRIELAPRLNPLGRLEGRQFIFTA